MHATYLLNRIYSRTTDAVCLLICIIFFSLWVALGGGDGLTLSICVISVYSFSCLFIGTILLEKYPLINFKFESFPFRFSIGFLVQTAFSALFLLFKLSIIYSFLITSGSVLLGLILIVARLPNQPRNEDTFRFCDLLFIIISLSAITLWDRCYLAPIGFSDGLAFLTGWRDIATHASIIRVLSNISAENSLQNIFFSNMPPLIYHYSSFFPGVIISALSGMQALHTFTSFVTPFSFFLTSIAAYVLVSYWWGEWPGLAATAGLLLLPNSSFHGLSSHWFDFHWILFVSPSLAAGILPTAISCLIMMESIKTHNWRLSTIAWLVWLFSFSFKAQLFVASAFTICIYPFVFWEKLVAKTKLMAIFIITVVFFIVSLATNYLNSVPHLFLNFSGWAKYSNLVFSTIENDFIRNFFYTTIEYSTTLWFVSFSFFLFYGTFGVFSLIYCYLLIINIKKQSLVILLFPMIVIAVYLVMAMGLPFEGSLHGFPEEFTHRPFAWAYFVVCIWSIGASYMTLFGNSFPSNIFYKVCLSFCLLSLLIIPYKFGPHVQIGPNFGTNHVGCNVPLAIIDACNFIRMHSLKFDIVQDSKGDTYFLVGGLSERPEFMTVVFSHYLKNTELLKRYELVQKIKYLTSNDELAYWFLETGVKWLVLHPDDKIEVINSAIIRQVFQKDGFRIIEFIS